MKKAILLLVILFICSNAYAKTMTITIPNDKAIEIVNAFCDIYGWTEETGLTKAQFAKARIREYIREVYKTAKLQALDNQVLQ